MKKTIFVIMMALLAVAGMNAQPQGRGHHGPRGGLNPEQMVEYRVAMLDKHLQLTPDQKTAIAAIYTDQAQKMKANMPQRGTEKKEQPKPEEMNKLREQMKAQQAEVDAKIASVLTAEQKAKYEQIQAEHGKRGAKGRHHDAPRRGHDKKKEQCDQGHECKDKAAGKDCCNQKAECGQAKADCGKGHECKDKAAAKDCGKAKAECDKAKADCCNKKE